MHLTPKTLSSHPSEHSDALPAMHGPSIQATESLVVRHMNLATTHTMPPACMQPHTWQTVLTRSLQGLVVTHRVRSPRLFGDRFMAVIGPVLQYAE